MESLNPYMAGQLFLPFLNRVADLLTRTAPTIPSAGGGRRYQGVAAEAMNPACQSAKAPTTAIVQAANRRAAMQDRYDALVEEMKHIHELRVHRWRSNMSGKAWTLRYRDGRVARLIESPYPRGPMSAAVFLHEVGHHVLGIGFCTPRCLEEYHAWQWSLDTMRAYQLNVTQAVLIRRDRSLRYAVLKAQRRGMKSLPPELTPYQPIHPRR